MAARAAEAPARSDAYTGLLAISLGAMITGCVFLYLDYDDYPTKKPEAYTPPQLKAAPPSPAPAGGAPTAPAGAPNR